MPLKRLGVVGYGEVGRIFTAGLKDHFDRVSSWDVKFPADVGGSRTAAGAAGVQVALGMQELCAQSDLVISAVTAANTLAVAQAAAPYLRAGMVFLDLNSASPGTKQQAAQLVEAAGAHYVEAGVMTSVPPYGIKVPMVLGGTQAHTLAPWLNGMGMDVKPVAAEIGVASAIKMCRSVMIKGLEALVIESYTTARAYGVEDHVLPTLAETFPSIDWAQTGAYFFSRVVQHGQRRAEEMRECAASVQEAGFAPTMGAAIAAKHQWVADQAQAGVFSAVAKGAPWQDYADALLRTRANGSPDA
ncbi:MAG: NAD(P)-dependent oxidoreductase [Burkholderiales bacterium]|nr:NAD(P)-dependent oxidoreductase [Burkholderiales bacterium]